MHPLSLNQVRFASRTQMSEEQGSGCGELVEKDGGFYVHYEDPIPSSLYAYLREHKDMSEIPDTGSRHFVDIS